MRFSIKAFFPALADEATPVGHAEVPTWAAAHFEEYISGWVEIFTA